MKFFELWNEAADFLKVSRNISSELDNFLKSKSCVVDFWVIDRWEETIEAKGKFPVGTIGPHNNSWVITILAELISDGFDGCVVEISFRLDGNPTHNMTVESHELSSLMHVIHGTFR